MLPNEEVALFEARQRARQGLAATDSTVGSFRALRSQVNEQVAPLPAAPLAPGGAPLELLAAVRSTLEAEFAAQGAAVAEMGAKRAQIEANNRRRTQVIIGLIVVPVVVVILLLLVLVAVV